MVIKKYVKGATLTVATIALFSGCAQQQPQPTYTNGVVSSVPIENSYRDTQSGNMVIEKHYIYTPDVNLKEAVVILAKKVEILERRISGAASQKNTYVKPVIKPVVINTAKIAKSGTYTPTKDAIIYTSKDVSTPIVNTLAKGAEVSLIKCDTFGWCELDGQEGYVQAWKFTKVVK